MKRTAAALALVGGAASLWLGCDQIFGLGDVNTIPYPSEGGVDGTVGPDSGADAGADSTSGGDSTTGGDGASGGDSTTVDAPHDASSDVHPPPSCDAAAVWAKMFASAIVPPYQMVGLDLRGADDGGITIQEIQAAACEVFDGGDVPPGEWNAYFGGDGSAGAAVVSLKYDPTSGRYAFMNISPGYTGGLDFHGADGGTYHMAISGDITKNGQPFPLDWADWNVDASVVQHQLTEIRNAMVATYAPGTPPSANCKLDQTCALGPGTGGTAYFGVRDPLFFYVNFGDTINHPSQPTGFYTSTNFLQYHDPGQSNLWQSFDTTQLGPAVKSFTGVSISSQNAMFLVPNGATTPVASFNLGSDAFTAADGGAWSTFDPSQLAPQPQGFAGAAFDGQFLFAAGNSGVCAQYDSTASFTFPGAWTTFDTKTLPVPAGKAFAGAVLVTYSTPLFVPSQDGVIAVYTENTAPSDFAVASNWVTFDLTTVNPRLKQFYGAVNLEFGAKYPIYLVPNKDTVFAAFVGWPAPVNSASSWSSFDVSTKGTPATIAPGYATGVHDQVRYVYFSPAVSGYPPVRYDTTQPFTSAAAWDMGLTALTINVKATGFDGRYVYFTGDSTTVFRYDTTQSFTSAPGAWTQFDLHSYDPAAVAFGGTGNDGRYQYFVPRSSSALMRFDARFGPPFPRPTWSSF